MAHILYTTDENDREVFNDNVEIAFDEVSLNYYVVFTLTAIGMGKTREEALEDLREAGFFGIDTMINTKSNPRQHQINQDV